MKRLSIEQAFVWTQYFVAREWRLLLPVALAFFALPPLLVDLFVPDRVWAMLMPGVDPAGMDAGVAGWVLLVMLGVVLFSVAGDLVICALALTPGISVREAIVLGVRRLGAVLGAILLLTAAVLAAIVVAALLLTVTRLDRLALQTLLTTAMWGLGCYLGVRMVMLAPLMVDRRLGPASGLRAAWAMGSGAFWRLLGGLAVYVVGGLVVVFALNSALGAMLLLTTRLAGVGELGIVLGKIVLRVAMALFAAGLQLLIVAFYRQLAASSRGI